MKIKVSKPNKSSKRERFINKLMGKQNKRSNTEVNKSSERVIETAKIQPALIEKSKIEPPQPIDDHYCITTVASIGSILEAGLDGTEGTGVRLYKTAEEALNSAVESSGNSIVLKINGNYLNPKIIRENSCGNTCLYSQMICSQAIKIAKTSSVGSNWSVLDQR